VGVRKKSEKKKKRKKGKEKKKSGDFLQGGVSSLSLFPAGAML
jgi:hypothetical protein